MKVALLKKYNKFRFIVLLFLIAIIGGCNPVTTVGTLPNELTLETYKSTGELESSHKIDSRNPTYQNLKIILDSREIVWSPNIVSYRTGQFVLRGEGVILRCYRDMLIVDVIKDGNSVSYKADIKSVLTILKL